jgi:hypothetical protein
MAETKKAAEGTKDEIFQYPVVELKIYPGKEGQEVEDIRVVINQRDFPDDFATTDYFLKSVANSVKNDADEFMTNEDRKKANNEYHSHHTEKIYFKPFHRKTEKRLKRALESFGIEEYNHYKDIIEQRNAIKAEKEKLKVLKETQKKETEKHEERLGYISIPVENEKMIFNPADYAMLSEFPKPSDYKALNFSTEAKRNVNYANKRFANGIGISPQVDRVQFKNEYFRPFIDREFLLKNKYIHDNAENSKKDEEAFEKSSRKPGSKLDTIVEETDGGKKRFAGGSYRPVSYGTFIVDNFKDNIDHVKQISDYETETKKDDTRISAPLETGVMVYVQLKGPDTMEATISKYIGYAVKDATGNTKCAAPINTAKLYGKENKCENFYTVKYYDGSDEDKDYRDVTRNKPIAVPQSRIKVINDSLVARLNDEINIPFENRDFFNFLHMVKYALTKMSSFTDKWNVKFILSKLKSMIKISIEEKAKKEKEEYAKNEKNKGNTNRGPFSNGGTRRRKKYLRKTRKNGGGTITTNPMYKLLSKYIDTSNITDNADDPYYQQQRIPVYVVMKQLHFLIFIAQFITTTVKSETRVNFIVTNLEKGEAFKDTLPSIKGRIDNLSKETSIFIDNTELTKINKEICDFINAITRHETFSNYKTNLSELTSSIEEMVKTMYEYYTKKILGENGDVAVSSFIDTFIEVLNKAYPKLYDSVPEEYKPPESTTTTTTTAAAARYSSLFGKKSKVAPVINEEEQKNEDNENNSIESQTDNVRVVPPIKEIKRQNAFRNPRSL